MAEHGTPEHLRSDNGPEFIAYAMRDWLGEQEVGTIYIKPGAPWEQAWIESFHDKLRDELLNREWFCTLREAQVVLDGWREEYNQERPHSSLGYLSPDEYAATLAPELAESDQAPEQSSVKGLARSSSTSAQGQKKPNKNQPHLAEL